MIFNRMPQPINLEEGNMKIKAIYDNGGKTVDRYTVVIVDSMKRVKIPCGDKEFPCLSLSVNPDSPQGVSHWSSGIEGRHLGKKINLKNLPENVQKHIKARLAE